MDTMGIPRSKGKALMFADAHFLAHTSRLLEIAEVLRNELGYEVVFSGDGLYMDLARRSGFETEWCYSVPKETTLQLAARSGLMNPFWWYKTVHCMINSDIEILRKHRPDIVIGDRRWSLRAAAHECGIPFVSVVNGAWTRYFSHPIEALDDHVLTAALGRNRATRVFPVFKRYMLALWAFPFRMWKRAGGHSVEMGTLWDMFEGDLTLLADVPEFCPTTGLPDSVRYVGPIMWNAPMPDPPWLEKLDPDRRTVYVSMGSSGKKEFFEMCRVAFAGTDYQVLMTTGEISLSAGQEPENFFITDFAPGAALMKRADVVICHGGNGTIYQAFCEGTPVIGIPTHIDQQLQLQLCERWRVGIKLREKTVSPDIIRRAVEEIIANPSYRENAERIERAIAGYGGASQAAREIDEFLECRRA
jgi:MGT family glycosyltransferase